MRSTLTVLPAIALAACAGANARVPASNPEPLFFTDQIEIEDSGSCFARAAQTAPLSPQAAVATDPDSDTPILDEISTLQTDAPAQSETGDTPVLFFSPVIEDPAAETVRFETLCPPAFTSEFVSSLQRALAARDAYGGPVSGLYDAATGAAILRFQRATLGLDSEILAIDTARQLGLVALTEDQIDGLSDG